MYGVVLWSELEREKAVIWCEDHGQLAFYNGEITDPVDIPYMEAGDLVHFDVREDQKMRIARNIKVVVEDHHPELALQLQRLKEQEAQASVIPPTDPTPNPSSKGATVIPFRARNAERCDMAYV